MFRGVSRALRFDINNHNVIHCKSSLKLISWFQYINLKCRSSSSHRSRVGVEQLLCIPKIHSFIHSVIHSGHFYSASSSPLLGLLRGAPDYSTDTVSDFHAEAHRQGLAL